MIVTSALSPAPTAAATSPAMKPIGRFSPTSAGRAGFDGVTVRGAAAVRGGTGPVNARRAAGGRLNGLTGGCSLIEPSLGGAPLALKPNRRRTLLSPGAGIFKALDANETPAISTYSPPSPTIKSNGGVGPSRGARL